MPWSCFTNKPTPPLLLLPQRELHKNSADVIWHWNLLWKTTTTTTTKTNLPVRLFWRRRRVQWSSTVTHWPSQRSRPGWFATTAGLGQRPSGTTQQPQLQHRSLYSAASLSLICSLASEDIKQRDRIAASATCAAYNWSLTWLICNNGRSRAKAVWNHHNNHSYNIGLCTQLLLQPVLRTNDQSLGWFAITAGLGQRPSGTITTTTAGITAYSCLCN